MKIGLIIIALFIIAAIAATISKKSTKNNNDIYKKKTDFLSAAERSFYGVLTTALAEEFTIFSKPRVADLIEPASKKNWQSAFNKISNKHIDFLLCEKTTLQPVLAIELDDKSHNTETGKARDNFLNAALTTANFPILRITAAKAYNIESLRTSAKELIK